MITICIIGGLLIAVGAIIREKSKANTWQLSAIAIMVVGFIVAVAGSFTSFAISNERILNNYIVCTPNRFPVQVGCVISDGKSFFSTKNDLFRNDLWVPGGSIEFESCDPPENFCVTCMEIRESAFCENCGTNIVPLCPNCGNQCKGNYCQDCGAKVIGENE